MKFILKIKGKTLNIMKNHQFEEITAALSIIIALLAYNFGIYWLFYIYFAKSCFDTLCAMKAAYKEAMKDKNNKSQTQ